MINNQSELIRAAIFSLLLVSMCICHAEENPRRHFQIVKVIGSYKPVNSARELPNSIFNRLSNKFEGCPGVADPENEFNPSCAIGTGSLPCQKILYAGNFDDIWFMEHLEGGTGIWQTFRAFRVENNRVISLYIYQRINGGQKIITTDELINSLSKTPECLAGKDSVQYRAEIQFGLCSPPEGSTLRDLLQE